MVFLDRLPGLDVNIHVDGVNLQEYNDDEDVEVKPGPAGAHQASVTVSKYIEATTGAVFSIKCSLSWQFEMDSPSLLFESYIDGHSAEGTVVGPESLGLPFYLRGPREINPPGTSVGQQWTLRKYKFSELDVSSEDTRLSSLNMDKSEAEKVGNIEIRIFRVSSATTVAPTYRECSTSNIKFHEKAFKGQAKSHSISYTSGTPVPAVNRVMVDKLDGMDYPIAIYRFKYRSKESLKQLLIIERTPEPEDIPAPGEAPGVDLENLTAAQRERLRVFLRNEGIADGRSSNTPERKVKRERDNGEGSSSQPQRKKSKASLKARVIDLTADSDSDE